jgi:uncharacterized protein YukE
MSTDRNMIVDSNMFSEIINDFDKKAGDVSTTLEQISKIMSNIDGENDIWRSETAKSIHEKYAELEKNFEQINAEFTVYSTFLKETQNEYVTEEQKQEKALNEYNDNLDLN